jgi:hypothetical protein
VITVCTSKYLRDLDVELQHLRELRLKLNMAVARQQGQVELLTQARDAYQQQADYWRARAERFMDQIGLSSGIISAPTMTEPASPEPDDVKSVFAALSVESVNTKESPTRAAAPTAVSVSGVDSAAAKAAVDEVLASVQT